MEKQWSYWEQKALIDDADLLVVGGGFTGLSVAYHSKVLYPQAKVVLLERDLIGAGASTKNAGFACYGTVGEICSDIKLMGRQASLDLVLSRIEGLNYLRSLIPDALMDYKPLGGYEYFTQAEAPAYQEALAEIPGLNAFFKEAGIADHLFQVQTPQNENFAGSIYSPLEAQLDPVKAISYLQQQCSAVGVRTLHGVEVSAIETGQGWQLKTSKGIWHSKNVVFCTNAFGVPGYTLDIVSARNQVLITKPFNHGIRPGNYHLKEGYIYLRTVGDRLLLGGARHLDLEGEQTKDFGHTGLIMNHLKSLLDHELQLAGKWELDQAWSGIIATGQSKQPLLKELENNLWYCGRFGGMGVALGLITGKQMAEKLNLD